ncbi:MAG: periplasmic heavy metal sensor [Aliishimia sp.]
MTDEFEKPQKPRRRWGGKVLALSLAVNFLVIGAVGGALMRHGGPDGARGPKNGAGGRADLGGFVLIRALDREDRHDLLQGLRDKVASDRETGRDQMAQLLQVLRMSPLDVETLESLMEAQQEVGHRRQDAMAQAWQAQVLDMTDEKRVAYADKLESLLQRKGKGKDKGSSR